MSDASINSSACTILKCGAFWTRLFKLSWLFCIKWIKKYSVASDNRAAGLKLLGARGEKIRFWQLKMSLVVKPSACPVICGLTSHVSRAWTVLCSPAQLLPSLLNLQRKRKKTRLNYSPFPCREPTECEAAWEVWTALSVATALLLTKWVRSLVKICTFSCTNVNEA